MPALSSVASSWLKTRNSWPANPATAPAADGQSLQACPALQRQDVKSLLFQLPAQPIFTVGDVNPLYDLALPAVPSLQRNSIVMFRLDGIDAESA